MAVISCLLHAYMLFYLGVGVVLWVIHCGTVYVYIWELFHIHDGLLIVQLNSVLIVWHEYFMCFKTNFKIFSGEFCSNFVTWNINEKMKTNNLYWSGKQENRLGGGGQILNMCEEWIIHFIQILITQLNWVKSDNNWGLSCAKLRKA